MHNLGAPLIKHLAPCCACLSRLKRRCRTVRANCMRSEIHLGQHLVVQQVLSRSYGGPSSIDPPCRSGPGVGFGGKWISTTAKASGGTSRDRKRRRLREHSPLVLPPALLVQAECRALRSSLDSRIPLPWGRGGGGTAPSAWASPFYHWSVPLDNIRLPLLGPWQLS